MTLRYYLVLIIYRIIKSRRKDRRVNYLNGSINLYSNLMRREKKTRRKRKGIRRRLNDKGKRTRRRWRSFYSGFLGR